MTTSFSNGYLEIILGCMFSGKTSHLIEIYKKCNFCNIKVCIINHSADTRYDSTMISTHDKVMVPCIQTVDISNLWFSEENPQYKELHKADVILINEAQFFPNLYNCVISMVQEKKRVHIGGLDGDFNRNKFGELLELIPYCDKVIKLTALCGICKNGTVAIFSRRITEEKEQTVIGSDIYVPVCRECFQSPAVPPIA